MWEAAIQVEVKALEDFSMFEAVNLPPSKKPAGYKYVFKIKYEPDGVCMHCAWWKLLETSKKFVVPWVPLPSMYRISQCVLTRSAKKITRVLQCSMTRVKNIAMSTITFVYPIALLVRGCDAK